MILEESRPLKKILAYPILKRREAWSSSFKFMIKPELLEEAKVGFPKIKIVNEGFISFLSKGYQLRYTDDLPSGYNIHLDQIKILAEQDRTVYSIRDNLKFETLDGKKIATRIDFFIEQKDQVLLDKNISFGNTDPAGLFKEKSSCLSLLVYGDHNIIEGIGEIDGTVDDGKFDVVGIKQGQ